MLRRVARKSVLSIAVFLAFALASCSGSPSVKSISKPSESKRQYLGLKKVAILPFTNLGGDKGAEDQAVDIVKLELNLLGTFPEVENPLYVADVFKSLKIRKLDTLDPETVKKLGSEMGVQALLLGDINAWGLGEGSEAAMHVSLTLTLIDTTTGKLLWVGSGSQRASFTWGRVFGLNEGPTDLEIGRKVVSSLLKSMSKEIKRRREAEMVRIKAEEAAKLKAAAEAEKKRLEEQKK